MKKIHSDQIVVFYFWTMHILVRTGVILYLFVCYIGNRIQVERHFERIIGVIFFILKLHSDKSLTALLGRL